VALTGAAVAAAVLERERRRALPQLAAVLLAVVAATTAAYLAWPARQVGPAALRVAAVQGNIRQSVKWETRSLPLAVARSTALSATLRSFRPAFLLWPETVSRCDRPRAAPALRVTRALARCGDRRRQR
jgi:apolipoprotein N-acyltransferase